MAHSLSSSQGLLTLETVKAHFDEWRQGRSRRKIPGSLLAEAHSLIGRYSKSEIAKALRLNYENLCPLPKSPPSKASFVEIPLSMGFSACEAEVLHPNGMALRLKSLTEQHLSITLKAFIAGS